MSTSSVRAEHFGAEEVDLRDVVFTPELLASLPAAVVRRYQVLPVLNLPDQLRVAIADPSDLEALDTVHAITRRDLELVVAEESQIQAFIRRLYPDGSGGTE